MDDLTLARTAAAEAAAIITRWRGRIGGAEFKGDVDPVTVADQEAEAAITALIATHRPDDRLLAEEGGASGEASERRWVIDPLDGTVNFLHGVPQVAVSIALEIDGVAALRCGPRRVPRRGVHRGARRWSHQEWNSDRGIGVPGTAQGAGVDGLCLRPPEPGRRVHPSRDRGAGGRSGNQTQAPRRSISPGSPAAGYAHWEFNLSAWDVAAGFLLVTEAGGVVLGFDGPPDHRGFTAGTPEITPALHEVVAGARVRR
jgi:myo-inositol-1(or 4)-monophosphatase